MEEDVDTARSKRCSFAGRELKVCTRGRRLRRSGEKKRNDPIM